MTGWRTQSCSIRDRKGLRNTLLLQTADGLLWSKDAPGTPTPPTRSETHRRGLYKSAAQMTTAKKGGRQQETKESKNGLMCREPHQGQRLKGPGCLRTSASQPRAHLQRLPLGLESARPEVGVFPCPTLQGFRRVLCLPSFAGGNELHQALQK